MPSAFLGLNTSKLGVMTHQKNLYTVGHNISNASTTGYSRQMVTSVTTPSINLYGASGQYWLGTGVNISAVTRARDFLIDRQLWKQTATNAYYANLNDVQSVMETIFIEPAETNFQAMLDHFWTAVQNVASNPGDVGTRTTMRQAAVDLVDIIKSCTRQLGDKVADINDNIRKSIDRVNQINVEILALNKQISSAEVTGGMANDLRDKRDLLVDELAKYARVTVNEDKMGNYIINFDGQIVVDAMSTTRLEVYENKNLEIYKRYGYQTLDVRIATMPPVGLNFTDGSIAGLLEARDSGRQGILSKLDMLNDIAKALLCDFNQVHKEGLGLDNSTGLNFFGEQNTQYAKLTSAITLNPITNLPIVTDPGFDPVAVGANNTEKNWIHHLKVGEIFFDSLVGLDKIAAKTLAGNLEIVLSTANRVNSVVPTTATQPAVNFVGESTMVFKGDSKTNVQVRVTSVSNDGFILSADYSLDGGTTWIVGGVDCTNDTGKSVLKLASTTPFEHNVQIAINPSDGTNLAVGDTYDLVLYPTTGGAASLTNTEYTRYESKNQTSFTLINNGRGPNGEVTGLMLSLDGGETEYTVYGTALVGRNADNTANIFTVWGNLPSGSAFAFQVEIKDDPGNTAIDTTLPPAQQLASGDKYIFKMPPSEAASDNAVRLAQFLKYGVDDNAVTKHSMYMGDVGYKGAVGDKSIDEWYNEGLGMLGVQTQTSYSMWLNQMTLVEQISTTRSNYKDVSLDEELTNMIMFQKGYNSNARMLTTMDEMLDRLINGTGRVGL